MISHRKRPSLENLRRWLATGCAALVFTLGLMSASPALHAWVHATSCHAGGSERSSPLVPLDSGHHCVVVWFAHGVALAADTATPASLPAVWHERQAPASDELLLVTPRYQLPPERGPPASLS